MSRNVVKFASEELDFDLADEAVVGSWSGPQGLGAVEAEAALREAIERPLGYPPLRQCVVPGDRVAIALGPDLPTPERILAVLTEVLHESGIANDAITVIAPPGAELGTTGAAVVAHDPTDREQLAYLASTAGGRRVYLNRALTDADVAIPVGRLGYDPLVGRQGPWGVFFPGLSDAPTIEAARRDLPEESPPWGGPLDLPGEAFEIARLLGADFQIGVVPGIGGPVGFKAGLAEEVQARGSDDVDHSWRFRVKSQAEIVVAGIGRPDSPTSLDELVEGLATAARLVQRGGRIVALSRAAGPLGPSLQRLMGAGETLNWPRALRGLETAPDSVAARRLTRVLSQADVYLLSGLDRDAVEDLSMIPLGRPEEARKLVGLSTTATFLSRAELTWGEVEPEAPNSRRSEG